MLLILIPYRLFLPIVVFTTQKSARAQEKVKYRNAKQPYPYWDANRLVNGLIQNDGAPHSVPQQAEHHSRPFSEGSFTA